MPKTARRSFLAVLLALGLVTVASAATPTAVYVTEHGTHYHTRRDCIALQRAKPEHVHTLELDAVTGRYTLCSICARRKAKP